MKKRFLIFTLFIFSSLNYSVFAQKEELPPPVMSSANAPPPPVPPGLPINDHIWILILIGVFIGAYYFKRGLLR